MILCTAMIGFVVLAEHIAIGQVVGPARRAAAGTAAVAGAPGVGARIENREAGRGTTPGDRWRYTNYGNQWWYYTPQNSWMYYQNNAWAPYDAATYSGIVPAAPLVPAGYGTDPDSWRYVHNGDQWWYYTPQNSWMSYETNSWQPYQARTNGAARYTTGYRGTAGADGTLRGEPPLTPVNPAMQDQNPGEKRGEGRDAMLGQPQQTSNQPEGNRPPVPPPSEQLNGSQALQGQPTAPPPARDDAPRTTR